MEQAARIVRTDANFLARLSDPALRDEPVGQRAGHASYNWIGEHVLVNDARLDGVVRADIIDPD